MANEYGDNQDSSLNEDTELAWVFGVIRLEPGTVSGGGGFSSGGPYLHTNDVHRSQGITGVSVNSDGRIAVTTDQPSEFKIGSFGVDEDETLSALGIAAGVTGGNGVLNIGFGQNGVELDLTQQADWNAVAGSTSNLWVQGCYIRHRGTGQPSKADQALTAIAALDVRLSAIEAQLESLLRA